MIGFIIPILARWGVPERFRRIAAWIGLAVAALALLGAAKAIYDASVVSDHETQRAVKSIDARDRSAEERADDAVRNIIEQQDREAAIAEAALKEAAKPENERAKLPPTTVAANCKRLEKAYTAAELAKIAAYQELCK